MLARPRQLASASHGSMFWMRAVSFAGLHRMLHAAASAPDGRTTAFGLNELVRQRGYSLTRRAAEPSLTTFYHYRTTLLRLLALRRDGRILYVNAEDPRILRLVNHPAPAPGNELSDTAKDCFAALVLENADCRSLFFDLFMPCTKAAASVSDFRRNGLPVQWRRDGPTKPRRVVFSASGPHRDVHYSSAGEIAAVLYGLRYWARNELGLIDEYVGSADGSATMFPVCRQESTAVHEVEEMPELVRVLLGQLGPGEWTLFSLSDLVARYCRDGRRPIAALRNAIAWLTANRGDYTVLIPTSRAMATLPALSPQQEQLVLRRYYKPRRGPYISHFRLHSKAATEGLSPSLRNARVAQQAEAHV